MRRLMWLAALAAVVACSGSGGRGSKASVRLPKGTPDPIVLRIPIGGGIIRAYHYPELDSLAWRSAEPVPEFGSALAFDAEDGMIAFADAQGAPGWIDLRLGAVRQPSKKALAMVASAEGSSIFGVGDASRLVRLTPTGDWSDEIAKGGRVKRLLPQPDGSLVVLTDLGKKQGRLIRLRPPEPGSVDSLDVGLPQRSTGTALGDRVYLAVGRELLGVPVEDFKAAVRIKAPDEILAVAPTPSGDRIFVASKGEKAIDVIDRYSASVTGRVRLPGFITELRMDPLGRYLLARPVDGDSAWVVAIGTESLVGAVHTIWREDLPLVAPDGAIATLLGSTVDFVDPVNHASIIKIENGDSDFWFAMLWNGFRPRAKGLDRAVTFQTEESLQTMGAARGDSSAAAVRDTTPAPARASQDAPPREETPPQPPPREPAARSATWIVSFAAVLSEDRARELARSIRVEGAGVARVSVSHSDGTAIYRVLMGPYSSRAEADRIGKASGHTYWITEGNS